MDREMSVGARVSALTMAGPGKQNFGRSEMKMRKMWDCTCKFIACYFGKAFKTGFA